MRDPVTM